MKERERIDFFYSGTATVSYSAHIKKQEEGVSVTCSEWGIDNEFYPSINAKAFMEEYMMEFDAAEFAIHLVF